MTFGPLSGSRRFAIKPATRSCPFGFDPGHGLALLAAISLAACNPVAEAQLLACPNTYDDAALDALWGKVPFLDRYDPVEQAVYARAQIAAYRQKVKAIKDPCWKAAFTHWLDYAEYEAGEAGKEAAKNQQVQKLLEEHPPL